MHHPMLPTVQGSFRTADTPGKSLTGQLMGNAVVVERMGAWSHSTKQRTRGTLEGSIVD